MVRINLLPAEVLEKRKYERFYPYLLVGAAIAFAIIALVWLGAQVMINNRSDELQQVEEQEAALNRQAQALAIFEQQQTVLQQRELIALAALKGRVDIGKIMEEMSLVLPQEVWVQSLTLGETDGMQMSAYTPDKVQPGLSEGFKSVAATLVRLGSLPSLTDVWLTSAEASTEYGDFQGSETGGSAWVMPFECSASVVVPTAVPAPPTQAGK